jgi:ABC-type transporter Mla maintaining outer membrane lipid asymmetry ATPase subunit MlaF
MVIVTHDVNSATLLADNIVMLHEGEFIFEGTPAEMKRHQDRRVQAFLNPRGLN